MIYHKIKTFFLLPSYPYIFIMYKNVIATEESDEESDEEEVEKVILKKQPKLTKQKTPKFIQQQPVYQQPIRFV